MDDLAVLVLNYTYEPLHFTNAKRAITLLLSGKAESVEASPRVVRSPSRAYPLPAVIRLAAYIRKPFLERVAFNKKNILRRDGYTCQYCARRGEKLTVDHIVPRSRGGQTTWTNVVAACLRCNLFKGNRTRGGGPIAADPRAHSPAVPLLRAPPPASPRLLLPRLLAEVSGGGAVELLTPLFTLASDFAPAGDQPRAIERLAELVSGGGTHSVLLGITGSGKTFTLANVISRLQRPALVISPNKTLAAQLYGEFKSFFPQSRGGVLRLVLRLLPARGLHPAVGHLHREGRADQRRDRPHAPLRDHLALRAARRRHRGVGVVHLRHRRARDVPGHARGRGDGAGGEPRRPRARPRRRSSTSGTTTTSAEGRSGCGATWWRCSPPPPSPRPCASSCSATASIASSPSTP